MTLDDTARLLMSIGGLPVSAPPINNACLPNVYNKLDAEALKKTKVPNGLLDYRLKVQIRMLEKYRRDADKVHKKEKAKIQRDLRTFDRKLPNMDDMPYLKLKIPMKTTEESAFKTFVTQPKPLKGIVSEREDKPFCDRFFHHHVPGVQKLDKQTHSYTTSLQSIKSENQDDSVLTDSKSKLLLSKRLSMSETCLSARGDFERSFLLNKEPTAVPDDDAITI
ncbi:uncharacterized protein LOC125652748 [Ostrea edulis]|uniref:uncharacterized protein LOC125652748 n=1 Tax=Ostrea edulis TaxID=37623 RepID=UPI0020957FCE|nr:uncharacterized protein LOC125652748 [Ostrea edulis]